jgi:hypothetical protein
MQATMYGYDGGYMYIDLLTHIDCSIGIVAITASVTYKIFSSRLLTTVKGSIRLLNIS